MQAFWKLKLDHVVFWSVTIGFHLYTKMYLIEVAGWWQFIMEIVLRNGLLAVIIYANIDYLIPALAQQRKVLAYGMGLAICFVFYILVKNTHDAYLTVFTGKSPLSFWRYSFYNFSIALFYMAFSLALELSKQWYFQRQRLRQMEVEKLNTELEFLKLQINPHFLFNSLNTIFFQIDKNNTDARETLTKFSDMLRFQLYECNGHEMPLDKEIAYLKNYVDLQRLRKDERYQIEFAVTGGGISFSLAPLLLMPLVENAFKYISNFPEGNNKLSIRINANPDQLELRVMNTKDLRRPDHHPAGGIGLKNLRRRLELQYPDRHALEINETKAEFEAVLKLMAQK
jgi:two-component system LytT family sensor kinase